MYIRDIRCVRGYSRTGTLRQPGGNSIGVYVFLIAPTRPPESRPLLYYKKKKMTIHWNIFYALVTLRVGSDFFCTPTFLNSHFIHNFIYYFFCWSIQRFVVEQYGVVWKKNYIILKKKKFVFHIKQMMIISKW